MIDSIALWHKRARPNPDHNAFNVQLGCHFEEFAEMLQTLSGDDQMSANKLANVTYQVMQMAEGFKRGAFSAYVEDRVEFLDACADQVVTSVGCAVCAGMDVVGAIKEVNTSNWSKFDENGNPVFDENGKIKKPDGYKKPQLEEFA